MMFSNTKLLILDSLTCTINTQINTILMLNPFLKWHDYLINSER